MSGNIVAEIKISRNPNQLVDVLLNFFLPDLEVVQLIISIADSDEVLYQTQLPQRPDLVKVLWQECTEHLLAEQPEQPWLEQVEINLLIEIQLQSQDKDEPLPVLKLLIFPNLQTGSSITYLDFGTHNSYSTSKTLLQSGRLLDSALILTVLEQLCKQTDLESLYVLDPDSEPNPWNSPFIFHRFPKAYTQDLSEILCTWSNPEQIETASLFGERSPEQITNLNQFLTFYHPQLKRKNTSITLLSSELATLWKDTQTSLEGWGNFSIFEPSEGFGVGIYSNTFFEGYCDQPYLALLKYLCTKKELLLPEDIDPSLAPPEIPEVVDEAPIELPEPEPEPEPEPSPPTVQERVAALSQELVLPKSPPLQHALNPAYDTEIAFQFNRKTSGQVQSVTLLYGTHVSDDDLREYLLRFRAYQDLNQEWYRLHQYNKDYQQWLKPQPKNNPSKRRTTVAYTLNRQLQQQITQLDQQLNQWENGALLTTPASDLQQAVTECRQNLQPLQYAVQGLTQLPSFGSYPDTLFQTSSDFRRQHFDTLAHFLTDAPDLELAIDDFFSQYYVTPDDPPQLLNYKLNAAQQLTLNTETSPWQLSATQLVDCAMLMVDHRGQSARLLGPPDKELAYCQYLERFGFQLPRFADLTSDELVQVLSQYCLVQSNYIGKTVGIGLGTRGTGPGLWLRWGTLGAGAPPDTPLTQIWEACDRGNTGGIWWLVTGTIGYPRLKMLETAKGWVQEGTKAYLEEAIAQMSTIDNKGLQETLTRLEEALPRGGVQWVYYHGHRDMTTGVVQEVESRQFLLNPRQR